MARRAIYHIDGNPRNNDLANLRIVETEADRAPPQLTADDITSAALMLFGPAWQKPLAKELGVSARTIRYWLAGERTIPASLRSDLQRVVARQRKRLAKVARDLA